MHGYLSERHIRAEVLKDAGVEPVVVVIRFICCVEDFELSIIG